MLLPPLPLPPLLLLPKEIELMMRLLRAVYAADRAFAVGGYTIEVLKWSSTRFPYPP